MIRKLVNYIRTCLVVFLYKLVFRNVVFGERPYFKGKINIEVSKNSTLKVGNNFKIQNGSQLSVRNNGTLFIDDNCSINVGSLIVCHNSIQIGKNTQIGPYCQIYDHDHCYKTAEELDGQYFNTDPIIIGEHVWIGGGVIILKGSKIGNGCVISAGSIVKGEIPDRSLYYCKITKTVKPIN